MPFPAFCRAFSVNEYIQQFCEHDNIHNNDYIDNDVYDN